MSDSFYNEKETYQLSFKDIGRGSRISKKASFYSANNITVGNNVRIDDFCIISGKVKLGDYVHISAGTYLFGGEAGIMIDDFSAISSGCIIYAETDDFYGLAVGNSSVPERYRRVNGGKVCVGKYATVGARCVILPSCTIGEGVSVAAMSLVNKSLKEWGIYSGQPCKRIMERGKDFLKFIYEIYACEGDNS